MAKVPAGEDQRIRDLSLLSRKHWTCGKCTNLGPLGLFQCQNDSCPSHETNLESVPTKEKSRAFALNRASVLRFRAIGGGHTTASKGFSFSWTTICVRPESTVYSLYVMSKDLACCISPVKHLLLLWMIRCYNPAVGKMPPKIYFSCFLGTKISES